MGRKSRCAERIPSSLIELVNINAAEEDNGLTCPCLRVREVEHGFQAMHLRTLDDHIQHICPLNVRRDLSVLDCFDEGPRKGVKELLNRHLYVRRDLSRRYRRSGLFGNGLRLRLLSVTVHDEVGHAFFEGEECASRFRDLRVGEIRAYREDTPNVWGQRYPQRASRLCEQCQCAPLGIAINSPRSLPLRCLYNVYSGVTPTRHSLQRRSMS